ncbi:MAG: diguanylate cyclase [Pseudomonadota bacterium]|nr:diguanylate cyclase [Pseudomonadota bacterium]
MKPLLIEDDLPASLGLRWRDQRRLYLARGFFALALYCYFLAAASYRPVFLDQRQLVAVLVSYLLVMGVLFWRARRNAIAASGRGRRSILNARLAMWVDYGALFIVVSHDPYDSIPAVLLLLPVLFGNGLRYGQRLLDEAVAGALVAVPVVIAFRGISGIVPQVDTMLTLLLYSVVVLYAGWLIRQASRLRRRLRFVSFRDFTTGMLNRRALMEYGELLFDLQARAGRPIMLLLVRLGPLDAARGGLLREVADALRDHARPCDLTAYLGEGRFVLLLPDLERTELGVLRDRLERTLASLSAAPAAPAARRVAGVLAPEEGTNLQALLRRAEQTLAEAPPLRAQPVRASAAS